MNELAYALEDEDLFEDFEDEDDDLDDAYAEDDDFDDLSERRRRRRRGRRRRRRIRTGRTGRGRGLFQRRPSRKYATQAQLKSGLRRVGKQIDANARSIKKVASQASRVSRDLGRTTSRLERRMSNLKKEVKKQGETTLLTSLLQKAPELQAPNPEAGTDNAGDVVANVRVQQPSNLLPLILMSGSGGLGGGDSNMLFLALALSGQL